MEHPPPVEDAFAQEIENLVAAFELHDAQTGEKTKDAEAKKKRKKKKKKATAKADKEQSSVDILLQDIHQINTPSSNDKSDNSPWSIISASEFADGDKPTPRVLATKTEKEDIQTSD